METNQIKSFFSKAGYWLTNFKVILVIYILLAVFASLQQYFGGLHPMNYGDNLYTSYNNYVIFKTSFFNLVDFKDLYCDYPDKCGDLYKYSPTFAVFMASFAFLPDYIGLILFNLLNALVLFYAIKSLPGFEAKKKSYMLFFVLIEMMTSMQNCQINALIAGLLILAFVSLEKEKVLLGTLFIVITVFIKLFGIVAFVLFLFYPRKAKFIAYSALWTAVFFLLPLILISSDQYLFLYKSWAHLLAVDKTNYISFSIMGCIESWFDLVVPNKIIALTGAVLFMIPLIHIKKYQLYDFRLSVMASLLVWVVIFNHMAESPSYVLAMTGMAIWFFKRDLKTFDIVMIFIALLFTSLTTTDIFPTFVRKEYIYPFIIKAVPSIFVWFWIFYETTFLKKGEFANKLT